MSQRSELSILHHVAVEVEDVETSLQWYLDRFKCRIKYSDETWALLEFGNASLALVMTGQHPPHVGFLTEDAADHGELKLHRDGTRSVYVRDPAGNNVELLDPKSVSNPLAL